MAVVVAVVVVVEGSIVRNRRSMQPIAPLERGQKVTWPWEYPLHH